MRPSTQARQASGLTLFIVAVLARVKTMTADSARKRVGTTLGTHVNFYVDTILTDAGFNAENVSATSPDLAPVMSRSDLDAIVPFTSFYSAAKTVLGDDCAELRVPEHQLHYILSASPEMIGN